MANVSFDKEPKPEKQDAPLNFVKDVNVSPLFASPSSNRTTASPARTLHLPSPRRTPTSRTESLPRSRASELHIETLNMMAKYQIVYLRFEAAVEKLAHLRKTRRTLQLRRAFVRYRAAGSTGPVAPEQLESLSNKLRSSLVRLGQLAETKARTQPESRALFRWRGATAFLRERAAAERRARQAEEKRKAELIAKDKELDALTQKQKQREGEIEGLREAEATLQAEIKEKEERERAMKETLDKFKSVRDGGVADDKRLSKKVEEKIHRLEVRARTLEKENQTLREQVDNEEADTAAFINEMNEVLDSTQFTSEGAL